MLKLFRRSGPIAPLVLLVMIGLSVGLALADADRSSPRALFDSFLGAMVDVRNGDDTRLEDATSCLDMSQANVLLRGQGERLAADLKTFLDKTERIDLESIPAEPSGERWVYLKNAVGEVSVVSGEDGWKFSSATVNSIAALVESVSERDFVEGLEGGSAATLADWVRERLPSRLLQRIFILENWQWLALAALIFIGVIIDRLVRMVVSAWVKRMLGTSEKIRKHANDSSFGTAVGILAMSLFWWSLLGLLGLPVNALVPLKLAAQLLMSVASVWALYRLVDLLAEHFAAMASRTETRLDDILIPLARRAVKIVVLAFVILFVAQNLNVDITSLLAGLGIGGIAFALAAKDTVENIFGSFTVLIDRPFGIGDWVVIGDQEGTVEEIGFRSTRLRTFYNSKITIPNAKLVSTAIDNLGERRYRRVKCMIGVQYDTPADRIESFCEGIRELIRQHPYTRKDYYMVYLNQFADSSLNILLYAFHETPDWPTELRERHRLFLDIKRLAGKLGVEFAFPTQTLHLASMPPDDAAAAPGSPMPDSDASRSGRDAARALFEESWPGQPQPPVSFDDPERIRPGSA